MLERLGSRDRSALDALRAGEWANRISPEEFVQRNTRLYQHPFGQTQIQTFGWRVGNTWPATLDVLALRAREKSGPLLEAGLIASVVTRPEFRGKGYARKLLQGVTAEFSEAVLVLHSEVPPEFYERFGFECASVDSIEGASDGGAMKGEPLERDAYCALVQAQRLALCPAEGYFLEPDPGYVDWQLERLRYFAELRKTPFPDPGFFRVDSCGHPLGVAYNAVADVVEGLEVAGGCVPCEAFLARWTGLQGLRRWRYWGATGTGTETLHPMGRHPRGKKWFDVQLGEWW